MLAANEAVAQYLETPRHRFAASRSRKAGPKKVLEFEEMAQAFGYSLGVDDLAERRVAVRHGKSQPPRAAPHGSRGQRPHAADGRDASGDGGNRHSARSTISASRKKSRASPRSASFRT